MKIEKINKIIDGFLTQNQICKELNNNSFCIHNDHESKLIYGIKTKTEESIYMIENEVLFCPFCGFSYQPERSKREDSEHLIINKNVKDEVIIHKGPITFIC